MHLSPHLLNETHKKVARYRLWERLIPYLALPILVLAYVGGLYLDDLFSVKDRMAVPAGTLAGFVLAFLYIRIETHITHTIAELQRLEDAPESLRCDPINGVALFELRIKRPFLDVLKRGF